MDDKPRAKFTGDPRYAAGTFLMIFGLPFLLGGLGALGMVAGWWHEWWQMQSWAPAKMEIAQLKLVPHRTSKGGTSYTIQALYRYRYEPAAPHPDDPGPGAPVYSGTRVAIDGGASNGSEVRTRFAGLQAAFTRHEPFTGFVNPERPAEAVLFRNPGVALFAVPELGALFTLIGAGFFGWGRFARRKNAWRRARAEADPERHWRWEPEWAEGFALESTANDDARVALCAAAGSALFALPVLAAALLDAPDTGTVFIGGGIALPVVAVWIWAGTVIARRMRWGVARLELEALPLSPGGVLNGVLKVPGRVTPTGDVTLEVKVREVVGAGRQARTRDVVHGEGVAGAERSVLMDRSELPVRIELPRAHPRLMQPYLRVQWYLSVRAKTGAVGFRADFELPVYDVPAEVVEKGPSF